MEDSEFEQVLNDKFDEQYAQWKDTCKVETTETWEQLVIGPSVRHYQGRQWPLVHFEYKQDIK